jgi:hypothetical protein
MPDFKSSLTKNGVPVSVETHPIQRGTAFTGSPETNDLYHRTDLGVICEYDGVRWLGMREVMPLVQWNGYAPWSVNTVTHNWVPGESISLVLKKITYGLYVSAANNATNYWSIILYKDAATYMYAINTASLSPGVVTYISASPGSLHTIANYAYVEVSKIGSPGGLYVSPCAYIRRVYT